MPLISLIFAQIRVIRGRFFPLPHEFLKSQNCIDLSKPQKPRHVTIEKKVGSELPKVHADGLWIELLLKNLLVNAFTAIP
ncbi:hypothetical protein MNBD_CHLOROFLEXI01-1307, partial [hydrothermal vent metagenome]